MKSALSKLPQDELERFGIDLNQEFIHGTESANQLINAWNERQKEVKSAVEGLMKPAEFMRDIIKQVQSTQDVEVIMKNLVVLESLLADIDNSRDFHTIGGWKVLVSFLQLNNTIEIRSQAALCIGTAVKNDYDYQLWILEEIQTQIPSINTGLLLLLHNLQTSLNEISTTTTTSSSSLTETQFQKSYRFINRLIYALSSCTRGNMDIQETLVTIGKKNTDYNLPTILAKLTLNLVEINSKDSFILQSQSSNEKLLILRKVWNLISDLLDELIYLREGLINEIMLQNQQTKGVEINDNLESKIKEATLNIKPIGEEFLSTSNDWISLTRVIMDEFSKECLLNDQNNNNQNSNNNNNDSPTLSPTPTTTEIKSNKIPIFNDSCMIFTSSAHRSIYLSAVNSYRCIKRLDKNSQFTEKDSEISGRIEMIRSHPSMIDE